jgi:hypothetical protein
MFKWAKTTGYVVAHPAYPIAPPLPPAYPIEILALSHAESCCRPAEIQAPPPVRMMEGDTQGEREDYNGWQQSC